MPMNIAAYFCGDWTSESWVLTADSHKNQMALEMWYVTGAGADQQIVHSLSLTSQLPDIKKSSHILLSQIASMCRGSRDGLD